MEIRLLLEHRHDLVAERTRTVNRLRWHLLELCPELEASLKRKALNQPQTRPRRSPAAKTVQRRRVRIAREQISHLRGLNRGMEQLAAELAELVTAHRPQLLAGQGCGALTAAILVGHTAGNEWFHSEAAFGLQTSTAPIPCSSGERTQHRLNRGGDRQLNHALHIIGVTRAQHDPPQRTTSPRGSRGQNEEGRAALTQAAPRPPLPPAALRTARRPTANRPARIDRQTRAPSDPRPTQTPTRARADHRR
jgi:transposase